jgi:hypothetical protein
MRVAHDVCIPILPRVPSNIENTFLVTLSEKCRNTVNSALFGVFPCSVCVETSASSYSSKVQSLDDFIDMLNSAQEQVETRGFQASLLRVSLQRVAPGSFDQDGVLELLLLSDLWVLCQCWEWDVAFLDIFPSGMCTGMPRTEKCSFVCRSAKSMSPSAEKECLLLVEAGLWMFHMFDSVQALNVYRRIVSNTKGYSLL